MSLGFDLSVDNYSTEDILSLLGLGSNPSITEINNKIMIFTNMFREVNLNKNISRFTEMKMRRRRRRRRRRTR